jgi:hypothetical protein
VTDVVHEYAVVVHAKPFVAGMRAGAVRQWGSAKSRLKRTVGVQHGVIELRSIKFRLRDQESVNLRSLVRP